MAISLGSLFASDVFTTPERPLYEAIKEAREMHRLGDTSLISIHLAAGDYLLEKSLTLRPEDSHIRLIGEKDDSYGGKTRIHGGIQLKGWRKQGKYMVCNVPEFHGRPLEFRQLYINGMKATRAKDVREWDDMATVLSQDRENKVLYVQSTPALRTLAKQGVDHAEMILHEMWCVSVLRISSLELTGDSVAVRFHQPEADIQFSHPWPSPLCHDRPKGWNASPFYLTNHLALLDEPGEWYLDRRNQKLYYYPQPGENITEAVVPVTETLVKIEGTLDRPATDITFEDIAFSYSTWLAPSIQGWVPLQAGMALTEAYQYKQPMERINNHPLDNQGWLQRPAAAVHIRGGQDIGFKGCEFSSLGSTGLDYEWGTQGGTVAHCLFQEIAGNGILAGSFSPSGLETHIAYNPADKREVVTGLKIEHNIIRNAGTEDWGTHGIAAGYVASTSICHNRIEEVPYTAISLGWGWNANISCMHDNKVHHNTINRYAKHMYDCAGIYTLGNQPGTEIFENNISDIYKPKYVHDPNHWFWLYTDEGSSNIYVHDNHCPSDKFLQNANGPCNVWENNVSPQATEAK